jgi:ribosomal protein RSM22 (predicted rRNA methylase)
VTSPIQVKPPVVKVIYIRMNKMVAAGGDLVIVDRGTREGFKVGDVLLSARPVPLDPANSDPAGAKTDAYGNITEARPGVPMTNYYLGQAMIVKAGERSATCRILRSTGELMVGDILTR